MIIIKEIEICFNYIGISFIQNRGKNTYEFLYLFIRNLEFFLFIETPKIKSIQLRIQYLNLDNNSSENNIYPVIFTPTKREKNNLKYLINIHIEESTKNPKVFNINTIFYNKLKKLILLIKIKLFNSIILDFEPITLRIEELFLFNVLEFYQSIFKQDNLKINEIFIENNLWKNEEISKICIDSSYINEVIISPLQINLTFKLNSSIENSEKSIGFLKYLIRALGCALSNIGNIKKKKKI